MHPVPRDNAPYLPAWLRRLGFVGFMVFLVKGLAWLSLPYLATVLFQ